MTHRKEQVESTLKRALAEIIQRGIADPRMGGLISITQVDCSPDLRDATVFISVLPEEQQNMTLAALKHAAGHIHSQLKKKLALKRVPRVSFRLDASLKRQAEVLAAIRRGVEKDQELDSERESKQASDGEQTDLPTDRPEDQSS